MVRIAPLVAIAIWIACIAAPASAEGVNRRTVGADPNLSDGATALSTGRYNEGVRLTKLGLEAPPKRGDRSAAMSNLCAGFTGTQRYDQALAHCRAALEIDDSNWQAYNNRALVYFRLGDLAAAQRDIDRGLALNPESGQLKRVQKLVDEASAPKSK